MAMYKEVIPGTEYDLFTDNTIVSIMMEIKRCVTKSIESGKISGSVIIGCLAWNEIKLKSGRITGIYLEYDAKVIAPGIINSGVNYMLIFDEIPDILLDRVNNIKELLG